MHGGDSLRRFGNSAASNDACDAGCHRNCRSVTLCLLVVCAAELEQDIIIFRKTVLNIIATPPPVFTPMRIAAIIITSGGINAALCTL